MPWTPEFNGIFFVFVAFFLQKMYSSKFTPIDSPSRINGGKFTKTNFLSYEFDKYKKIPLNSGVHGMSNQ